MSDSISVPNYQTTNIKTFYYSSTSISTPFEPYQSINISVEPDSSISTPYQPNQSISIPLEDKPAVILEDLINVDTSTLDKTSNNTTRNYIMVYDGSTGQYKFVNPDVVLSTAASQTEPISPGLPEDFLNSIVLESIDLDAGTF